MTILCYYDAQPMKKQRASFSVTIKHALEREAEVVIGWTASPFDRNGRTLGLGTILMDVFLLGLATYALILTLSPGDWPTFGGFLGLAGVFTGLFVAVRIIGNAVLDSRS